MNFLPALPLDGGLILRSVLATRMSAEQAHRWASSISLAVLATLALTGIILRQPALAYFTAAMTYDIWKGRDRARQVEAPSLPQSDHRSLPRQEL